jgi:hypothetical protein
MFRQILRHKTGTPSNSSIRKSASLVQMPLVSVDGIHDDVHMIGITIEIVMWSDENKLQADDYPLAGLRHAWLCRSSSVGSCGSW